MLNKSLFINRYSVLLPLQLKNGGYLISVIYFTITVDYTIFSGEKKGERYYCT